MVNDMSPNLHREKKERAMNFCFIKVDEHFLVEMD